MSDVKNECWNDKCDDFSEITIIFINSKSSVSTKKKYSKN